MTNRANLIKNLGLITNKNELAVSEGSLRQATNINVDEEGVATSRRGFNDYGGATTGISSTADVVKQIFEYKDRVFRHFSDKIEFEDNVGTFNAIAGTYQELLTGYRIKWQESNGNMYFTTDAGIKKISLKDNSSLVSGGTLNIENAGIPKAAYIEATKLDTVGGFLPAQSKVAYRFIFGKKDVNNNLLLGGQSSRYVLENSNTDVEISETFVIDINNSTTAIATGNYILIPTLNLKTTFYFDLTGSDSLPIDSNTVGTNFIQVDISAGGLTDTTIAAILGNEISNALSEYSVGTSSNQVTCTSSEQGDIVNATIVSAPGAPNAIDESSRTEGSFTDGLTATADVTVILPTTITTDFFIQVYRTNFLTATLGLDLTDVDPGDEMNLVYEYGLETGDITDGEYTFNDSTPESFRASAAPLYTNEITGEGVLQANDQPPIAHDIELFSNSMFYANTKSSHRLEFTILSVDDYVNDTTDIVIGNSTLSRRYTAAAVELKDTTDGGDFKLSVSASVGQAIDETSRSLVKIINQDSLSPVNAFYLSGADDLPGQVLLEARDLTDTNFYVAVDEPTYVGTGTFGDEFSPSMPLFQEILSLNGLGTTTEVTINGHGFVTGDEVYVSYNDSPTFSGVYSITNALTNTFEIPVANVGVLPITNATATFSPDVESDNLEAANRLYYSKTNEPEAVPFSNFINVGAKDEPIRRILALRNNLFVLKDDGVFLVSGSSAPNFTVRQTDNTRLLAPDSAVVLNNQIYCLTDQGISRINGSGQVGIISRGIENLIDKVANASFDFVPNTFGVAYENDRAYVLFMPELSSDTSSTQAYRYNIFERTWTRWEYDVTCGLVMGRDNKLYVGNGDRNYVSQERKNFDRTDNSDRNFTGTISLNGVSGVEVELGNLLDVEVADVITQTQDVTINFINSRILRRMDEFDIGLELSGSLTTTNPVEFTTSYKHLLETGELHKFKIVTTSGTITQKYLVTKISDFSFSIDFDNTGNIILSADITDFYQSKFSVEVGDDMSVKVQSLNDYLNDRDANITPKVITSTNLQSETQTLIDELNASATITSIKSYASPETITYEAYIKAVDPLTNKVTLHMSRPFLTGDIDVYKHINKVMEWNPQHFGDPSALKQVREVTIMFDQNNFYDATARFGSDVSQNLVDVDFQGKGIGYWGDKVWSDPNHYWGGEGNDIPFRTIVPRGKQRCRYLTIVFEHQNAREAFRILGISGVVRAVSSRAYK